MFGIIMFTSLNILFSQDIDNSVHEDQEESDLRSTSIDIYTLFAFSRPKSKIALPNNLLRIDFASNFSAGAAVKIYNFCVFRGEVGISSFSEHQNRDDFIGEEELSITLLPISMGIGFQINLDPNSRYTLTPGAGIAWTYIRTRYLSKIAESVTSASTYMPYASLSATRRSGRYSMGLEGRYYWGGYDQSVQQGAGSMPESSRVSLEGPYAGVTLKYHLR